MRRTYHSGKKTDHDYATDFEYQPFDVFAHCHKDIDTSMHYHATEIVTNGYEIELTPPNTTEQWEINQKDWRIDVDGNTNREYNTAPLGHFADDSQPGHLTKRPFLRIHPSLTEAQALQALNVYLFLSTHFDWYVIPAEIEEQQLTWAHAIKQAKAYALAADATRPYAYNYPYPTEQHQAPYTPLGQHSVEINREERTRLLGLDTTFN